MSSSRNRLALLAIALGFASAAPAHAGLIPSAVSIAPDGGNHRFTYALVLPSDYTLKSGDYFTIYDFDGLVAASNVQPAGWTFSSAMSGQTPSGLFPTDDATKPNLTWTYGGPDLVGSQGLGNFWAQLTIETGATGWFTSINHKSSDGAANKNITETTVPYDRDGPPIDSPEPASALLLGLALPVLGAVRAIRRRRTA